MGPITNERLRTWLNANQAARERLCIGILRLLPDYSDARPRRPEGGPDGGRDIDVYFRGLRAVGAVGFRNNARDDRDDKRWVEEKATLDAQSGRVQVPDARHFAFFTNIDLTPSEVETIKKKILSLGYATAEIFYRERIRLVLDSPDGMALRFQFLDIELSNAEQAAFFSRFASLAEDLSPTNPASLRSRVERLEFLQYASRPIEHLGVVMHLKEPVAVRSLLGSTAVVSLSPMLQPRNDQSLILAAMFRGPGCHGDTFRHVCPYMRLSEHDHRQPPKMLADDRYIFFDDPTQRIDLQFGRRGDEFGARRLMDLDGFVVWISLSSLLRRITERVDVIANDYVLASKALQCNNNKIANDSKPDLWPKPLHYRESNDLPCQVEPHFDLNFRLLTPRYRRATS